MKNLRNYIIAGLAFLLLAAAGSAALYHKRYLKEKAEKERVSNNYRVSQEEVKQVKGENGLLASRIEAQELTLQEIRTFYSNIEANLKDMKIQLRKISGITAFNTETTNNINTLFKDSTVVKEKPIEVLNYSDQWFDIRIRKEGLQAHVSSISRDSLIQVVHWDRAGEFWPTKWLTKKVYFQDIKSTNPGSRITYSKWIVPLKAH